MRRTARRPVRLAGGGRRTAARGPRPRRASGRRSEEGEEPVAAALDLTERCLQRGPLWRRKPARALAQRPQQPLQRGERQRGLRLDTFSLADARTGQPLHNLRPYLAAAGHIVIMRADGQTFAHEHADVRDGSGRPVFALPGTTFGPDLPVHVHFEEAGTYRLWGQFRLGSGQVSTAPFTVQAVDGEVDAARAVRVVGVAPGSPARLTATSDWPLASNSAKCSILVTPTPYATRLPVAYAAGPTAAAGPGAGTPLPLINKGNDGVRWAAGGKMAG